MATEFEQHLGLFRMLHPLGRDLYAEVVRLPEHLNGAVDVGISERSVVSMHNRSGKIENECNAGAWHSQMVSP